MGVLAVGLVMWTACERLWATADILPGDDFSLLRQQLAVSDYVFIPAGDYALVSTLKLKNGIVLEGIRGQSRIIIDDSFQKGKYYPENEFAVMNEHFSQAYDSATADEITIRGLTFIMDKNNSNSIHTLLGMANVKKLILEDCDFIVQGNGVSGSNIDLYAGCKNVLIRNCYIKNDTGAESGAAVMVRCLTGDGADPANATENVVLESNTIEKNSNDEAIAVWGCVGLVRDVTVRNNSITAYGRIPDVLIDAFAGEFNKHSTASTKNVIFDGNTITTGDIACTIFQVGQNTDTVSQLDNVRITNNTINTRASATAYTTVIKSYDQDNYTNIVIEGNEITNTGHVNIGYGITGKGVIANNVINGLFNASIAYAYTCNNNTINDNITGTAIENVVNIESNTINNCKVGIKCFDSETYWVAGNSINMHDSSESCGIMALKVSGSNPVVSISDNQIAAGDNYYAKIFSHEGLTILSQ
jgi:hypothetical protein